MTRILVTGATGGLGRNAVRALLADGCRVRATGRDRAAGAQLAAAGADFVPLDLAHADAAALAPLLDGVDVVWHCAALASPWGPRADFVRANVDATHALVGAAAAAGVARFVYVSTPAVYFDFRHRYDVREDALAARPVNHYAATKLEAEEIVRAAGAASAMRCAILRPRAIFGPHDRVLLPRLLDLHRKFGGTLPLPRGGRTVLDITYVDNVVHALRCAGSAALPAGTPVYNVSNGDPVELRDVVVRLFGALGRRHRIADVPYPLMACAARVAEGIAAVRRKEPSLTTYGIGALAFDMTLDIGRARGELSYAPPVGVVAGIQRTAAWLKEYHG